MGGEFEIAPQSLESEVFESVPTLPLPYLIALDTGRSGILVALEDIVRRGGRKVAYLPVYCCESVFLPFRQLDFELRFYAAGGDLASPDGLPSDYEDATFLYIHYFGLRNDKVTQWVKQARNGKRLFVIEDCVQASLTTAVGSDGDYAVTSLRKMATQPDGAVLGSRTPLPDFDLHDPDESFVSMKLVGKLLRYQQAPDECYLKLLEDAEDRLNGICNPRRPSWVSSYLMARTDFTQVAKARRQNWSYLHSQLRRDHLELIRPFFDAIREGEVPLGYPVMVASGLRDRLRSFLKERGVFCAVHWPLGAEQHNAGWPEEARLSHSMLTLPIDQRMSVESLDHAVDSIRQFSLTR
jgi:hypothetical protein